MTKFPVLIALITVMSFAFSHQSAAQNATRCINLGSNSNSKTLRNTCNRKVEVVWCHNSSKRGVKSGRCGPYVDVRRHVDDVSGGGHETLEAVRGG